MEDILRACALEFKGNWDDYLHLSEFAYNNSYQSNIGMTPFEVLYSRNYRSPPIYRVEVGERKLIGPTKVKEDFVKIETNRERLKVAQSKQKSYADTHRRNLEFSVGNHVFPKVSPTKGVMHFGKKGKLSPRYVGPFEILNRVGEVAYRLALLPQLSEVHKVFHVSMLRKYEPSLSYVVTHEEIPL